MAAYITINCPGCQTKKTVQTKLGQVTPDKCDDCIAIAKAVAKGEFLKRLKTLSVEQRLALLEEWAYDSDNNPQVSMSDMLV